jgi:lipopolysaccharide assembly outer membrane protein LptD (OstA)
VVVTNDEGATLRAPFARYDRKANKVFAWGGVSFKDPRRNLQFRGKTLTANVKLHAASLTGVAGSGDMRLFEDKTLF